MTNINHEYPEYTAEENAADSSLLKHYQSMALESVAVNARNLTDAELVRFCLNHSSTNPMVRELATRLEAFL